MPITSDLVTVVAVAVSAVLAASIDLATRRIPNAVTLATAIIGIALAAAGLTRPSTGSAAMGFAVGLLVMLPSHLLGATGAGDVKLFAALATFLGVERVPAAFVYTALSGGFVALGFAARRGRIGETLSRTARLVATPVAARREIEAPGAANRFPYGPAVAVGCVLAAW